MQKADTRSEAPRAADASDNTTPHPDALPRLAYTMRETAKILGVSYITVWRLLQRGKLHASDAIRNKIIPRVEIERFLVNSTVANTQSRRTTRRQGVRHA